MVKPLYVHNAKFSPDIEAQLMATEMLKFIALELYDETVPSHLQDELNKVCTYLFDPNWSEREAFLNAIWLQFYMMTSNKLCAMHEKVAGRVYFDLSIDELVEMQAHLDRILEYRSILSRAKSKLFSDEQQKSIEDSPLKAIKAILKVRKFRPQWTYNPGVYER